MKKVSLLLLFIVALCLLNSCSYLNVPGANENVWVADGFKLTEDDEVFLVITESKSTGSFQAVLTIFNNAGLLESENDLHIVESIEKIKPSGNGRVYFVEYTAVPAYADYSGQDIRGFEQYSFFSINVYDYRTKSLVASNSFDPDKSMVGTIGFVPEANSKAFGNVAIYSTTHFLLEAIVPEYKIDK